MPINQRKVWYVLDHGPLLCPTCTVLERDLWAEVATSTVSDALLRLNLQKYEFVLRAGETFECESCGESVPPPACESLLSYAGDRLCTRPRT
jgi:hypothetical protein